MSSSEVFDDFDSTDLAIQLTEMANRRQLLEAASASERQQLEEPQPIATSANNGRMGLEESGVVDIEAMLGGTTDGNVGEPSDSSIIRAAIDSKSQQINQTSESGHVPVSDYSSLAGTQRLKHINLPQTSAPVRLENSLTMPPKSPLILTPQDFSNLSALMSATTKNVKSAAAATSETKPISFHPTSLGAPLAQPVPVPVSLLPNWKNAPAVRSDVLKSISPRIIHPLPVSSKPAAMSQALSFMPQNLGLTSADLASITKSLPGNLRRTSGLDVECSTSTSLVNAASGGSALVSPTVASSSQAQGGSLKEELVAEALMQQMIEEGRLHGSKRQRSKSNSSRTSMGQQPPNFLNSAAAAADHVMRKQPKLEQGHIDNLYVAYTAAVQQAAAVAAENTAGKDIDIKPALMALVQQQQLLQAATSASTRPINVGARSSNMESGLNQDSQGGQIPRLISIQPPSSSAADSFDHQSAAGPPREKAFHCLACGKSLSSLHNLKLHETTVHKGVFQYRCPLCGKGLRQERDLRGHLANRHNMKKDFRCTICGNEFGYKRNLKQHMVSYHGWRNPILQYE